MWRDTEDETQNAGVIYQHHNIHRILTITITHIDKQQQCKISTVSRLGQKDKGQNWITVMRISSGNNRNYKNNLEVNHLDALHWWVFVFKYFEYNLFWAKTCPVFIIVSIPSNKLHCFMDSVSQHAIPMLKTEGVHLQQGIKIQKVL